MSFWFQRKNRFWLAQVVIVVGLASVGCGDDSDDIGGCVASDKCDVFGEIYSGRVTKKECAAFCGTDSCCTATWQEELVY